MNGYTIIDVAKDLIRGKLKFASRAVASSRISECNGCEVYDSKHKKCTVCGCYMPAKTKLELSSCPMGKW
jgi:hypothetical protein